VFSGRACRGDGVHSGVDVVAMSFSRGSATSASAASLDQAREEMRSSIQGGVTELERMSRGTARLTATFTSASGDLPE
jgi:hypothetical protein